MSHTPVQIISVLGPPGSGKGTQCAILQTRYHCAHLSAGDLLRAEAQNENSPWASLLRENVAAGKLGPKQMTIALLKRRINELVTENIQLFFVDGSPRRVDAAKCFEEEIEPIHTVLVLKCSNEVLMERLLRRARADDDKETIQKRIDTFDGATAEVLEVYREKGKLVEVNTEADIETVAMDIQKVLEERGVRLEARDERYE